MGTIKPVKMRYKSDCGVAALAMARGSIWDGACQELSRANNPWPEERGSHDNPQTYWGVEREHMQAACEGATWHGTRTFPTNARGVMYVHGETEWQETSHWLAWESDEAGRVTLVNPTDGESFPLQNLHTRGFRMVEWLTVESWQG